MLIPFRKIFWRRLTVASQFALVVLITPISNAHPFGLMRPNSRPRIASRMIYQSSVGNFREASYSRDGSKVLVVDFANVKVLDADTGDELLTVTHSPGFARSACFSPDGSTMVTCNRKSVRFWNAKTGAKTLTLLHQQGTDLTKVVFSRDGTKILTSGRTGQLWDLRLKTRVFSLVGGALSTSFSPNEKEIVGTAFNEITGAWNIIIWSAETGAQTQTLSGHRTFVRSTSYAPDGSKIVTASSDGTAKVWDAVNGEVIYTLRHGGGVNTASFSPDGKMIVTASDDNTVKIWYTASGSTLMTLRQNSPALSASFSPDGKRLLTASSYGKVTIWSLYSQDREAFRAFLDATHPITNRNRPSEPLPALPRELQYLIVTFLDPTLLAPPLNSIKHEENSELNGVEPLNN